jgi:hypothetical protein
MKRIRIAAAMLALAATVALAGCVGSPHVAARQTFTPVPTPTAAKPTSDQVLAEGAVDTVLVVVYPGTAFKATHGCGCSLPGDRSEQLFPAGTPVVLLKITLTGEWKPSQGNQTYQDVTGTKLTGTKFDGRPELAVLDTADGPAAAHKLALPWLPSGLFAGRSDWRIPNNTPVSFAVAWYVPAGVTTLELTVNVPSEGEPNHLTVTLPAVVQKMLVPDQE